MLVVKQYVQDGFIAKGKAAATRDTLSQKVSSAGTDEKRSSLDTAKGPRNTMLELEDLLEAPSTQRNEKSS